MLNEHAPFQQLYLYLSDGLHVLPVFGHCSPGRVTDPYMCQRLLVTAVTRIGAAAAGFRANLLKTHYHQQKCGPMSPPFLLEPAHTSPVSNTQHDLLLHAAPACFTLLTLFPGNLSVEMYPYGRKLPQKIREPVKKILYFMV